MVITLPHWRRTLGHLNTWTWNRTVHNTPPYSNRGRVNKHKGHRTCHVIFMMRSRIGKKVLAVRGFVKKSAKFSADLTNGTTKVRSSTFSRIKKCRRSICFVRAWCSGLYAKSRAAWLSTLSEVGWAVPKPSSLRNDRKCVASLAASLAAIISASHDDSATQGCFLDIQEMAARLS